MFRNVTKQTQRTGSRQLPNGRSYQRTWKLETQILALTLWAVVAGLVTVVLLIVLVGPYMVVMWLGRTAEHLFDGLMDGGEWAWRWLTVAAPFHYVGKAPPTYRRVTTGTDGSERVVRLVKSR